MQALRTFSFTSLIFRITTDVTPQMSYGAFRQTILLDLPTILSCIIHYCQSAIAQKPFVGFFYNLIY